MEAYALNRQTREGKSGYIYCADTGTRGAFSASHDVGVTFTFGGLLLLTGAALGPVFVPQLNWTTSQLENKTDSHIWSQLYTFRFEI